jgi:CheY-like chemotaxis protein
VARILIVDDNSSFLEIACSLVESAGHECLKASTINEAIKLANAENLDCFILDIRLGDLPNEELSDGVDLFEKLKTLIKSCKVIFSSAYTDYSEDYLLRRGATILIDKQNFSTDIGPALEEVFYPRVLLIDDDYNFANVASYRLADKGIKCVSITEKSHMVNHVQECDLSTFDVIVTDVLLNGEGNFQGWDVVSHLMPSYSRDLIFMITDKRKVDIEKQIGRKFDDLQTRQQLLSAISHLGEHQVLNKDEEENWLVPIEQACTKAADSAKA